MFKQWMSVVAIAVVLSACASTGMPPAQTVAFGQTRYTTDTRTGATQVAEAGDPAVPQATVSRVFWFFGGR